MLTKHIYQLEELHMKLAHLSRKETRNKKKRKKREEVDKALAHDMENVEIDKPLHVYENHFDKLNTSDQEGSVHGQTDLEEKNMIEISRWKLYTQDVAILREYYQYRQL